MKIATWNVNSLRVRLPHLLTWLATHQPNVMALQETKLEDASFPVSALQELGYQAVYAGQKTYNGVALLSKAPLQELAKDFPGAMSTQQRLLAATVGQVRIITVYVPNGESVGSEKYHYKLQWLQNLSAYLQQAVAHYQYVVVLGDFNIAPADQDVHDPEAWLGSVLVADEVRTLWQEILSLGFQDAFRLFDQAKANPYSWWDYRAAAFRRNQGLRIDHILVSNALATHCKACQIDKTPRAWERPSDHAPVITEFAF